MEAARLASRTTPQQIAHWARIGRQFEASPSVSQRDIRRVLAGHGAYAELDEREQAVVRAEWDEQIAEGIASLDFEAEFTAAGDTWAIGDGTGNAVIRGAAPEASAAPAAPVAPAVSAASAASDE